MKTLTVAALPVLVLMSFASAMVYPTRDTKPYRVVGYYSMKAATTANLDSFPFHQLTHINLYFLNPDSTGNFSFPLDSLHAFIEKAHANGVAVMPSIAGGGPHPYYHHLLEPGRRKALVESLARIVVQNNFDGLDVDLEGGDIDTNYTKFVTELARALHANQKKITAAIAVFYKDILPDSALAQFDFMNVMSYDHTGPWNPAKPGPHATYEHAVADLDYFLNDRNIEGNKLTLGLPFYGYSFGPDINSPASGMGYSQIVNTFAGGEQKDSLLLTTGATLYYNGIPTIIAKTEMAKEKTSGVMIWQISADDPGERSLLRAINKVLRD